jgi:hypothetical protein
MKVLFALCIFALLLGVTACSTTTSKQTADTRCFEMRIYTSPAGRLNDLNARFRDYTLRLFEKHGIQNIGYWVPIDNTENKLIYVIAYPSRDVQKQMWNEFINDPEWKAAAAKTEANGRIVSKVESYFMTATDYSPMLKIAKENPNRTFELRTYTTTPGKLPNLDERFRDHTINLFKKHGMQNIVYWHRMPDQKNASDTLVYILAHKSKEAGLASFDTFRKDPKWIKAKQASEEKAGGSLTVPDPNGVVSTYMVPTDYSPIK